MGDKRLVEPEESRFVVGGFPARHAVIEVEDVHLRNRRLETDDGGCWAETFEAYRADFLGDRKASFDDASSHVHAQVVEIYSGSLDVASGSRHNGVPSFFPLCLGERVLGAGGHVTQAESLFQRPGLSPLSSTEGLWMI